VQAGYQVCGVLCVINRWGYDEIVFGRKLTEAEQDKGFIAAGDITLPIFSLFKESDFQ
jgi:hypothetical protein